VVEFLALRRISKLYGGIAALDGLDFDVAVGEVHCLLGENGSGKSTLVKIISGFEQPEPGGEIAIDGRPTGRLTSPRAAGQGIQVIYQDFSLFPNLTVAENVAARAMTRGGLLFDMAEAWAIAKTAMARVNATLDLDALVGDLPIAQRQLVAISRALAAKVRLVIMDEPTASLARHEVEALVRVVAQLRSEGVSIIFVSHRLDEILEVADRVTVLRDGRSLGTFGKNEISNSMLSRLMTGAEFDYKTPRADFSDIPPVVSVMRLTRAGEYNDISFSIRPGEIFAITGLLGAGRTELALSLFGITQPDSGAIEIDRRAVQFKSNRDAMANGIAYVPEDRLSLGLILPQPIAGNLVLTLLRQLTARLGLFDARARDALVADWIRRLAIKALDVDAPVRTLSGGNQQRVVLAKWLARKPRLLILDSPTVGVDISAKDGIYNVVATMAAQGVAIILISDEIPEALYHSHRVMVMRQGEVVRQFVSAETSEQELAEAINA
jgi:simple sugar transport system ATP-binding protein